MSLLFIEGFETGDVDTWGISQAGVVITGEHVRSGTYAYALSDDRISKNIGAASDILTVGIAVKLSEADTDHEVHVGWRDADNQLLFSLHHVNGDVELSVHKRGSGSDALDFGNQLDVITGLHRGTWYYIEFQGRIHQTDGFYEVRVDGVTRMSGSGIDTKEGFNALTGEYVFTVMEDFSFSLNAYVDDIYLLDDSGTINNDFLGPIKIEALTLDGNGSESDFVGSDADSVDNYLLVDEFPPNSADYVESDVVGATDLYSLSDKALAGDPVGVRIDAQLAKDDEGARTAAILAKLSTTEDVGDAVDLVSLADGARAIRVLDADPDGTAWADASVNSLEVGVRVIS